MTTLVEEDLEQQRDTGNGSPEWDAWLAMDVPCIVEDCPDEVVWWGSQHGCVQGPMCDNHMMRFISRLRADFSLLGRTDCNYCNRVFTDRNEFFKARRI